MTKPAGPFRLRNIPFYESAGGYDGLITLDGWGTLRLHPGNANVFLVTARSNLTIRLAPLADVPGLVSFTLGIQQDTVGSRTVTWGSEIDWGTTGAPTLSTTASRIDWCTFVSSGTRKWHAFLSAKGFGVF